MRCPTTLIRTVLQGLQTLLRQAPRLIVEAARLAKKKPAAIPIEDGLIKYMCITSKLLHLKALGVQDKLKCGRRLSANFCVVCGEHAGLLLRCAQCFP